MKLKVANITATLFAGALLTASASYASLVGAGDFTLTGGAVGTNNGGVIFALPPTLQEGSILGNGTGAFSGLMMGQIQTINSLLPPTISPPTANEPNWIQLSDGINIDLVGSNALPLPGIGLCSAIVTPVNGQTCVATATSPVFFTQGPGGVTATLITNGEAHFVGDSDLTPIRGVFSSSLLPSGGNPLATLTDVAAFFTTNSHLPPQMYTATFETTSAVPEPAAAGFMGAGILGLGLLKLLRKRQALS